jgi:oligosaccharide repeat unit polymerase
MLFIVLWLITLVISTYLFQKVSGSLSLLKPNLISIVFYYSLLVSTFIGALLIALDIDQNYMLFRMYNKAYKQAGFYWVMYIMLLMPLSMLLTSQLLGFKPKKELEQYLKAPIKLFSPQERDFFYIIVVLAAISLLAVVYTILKLEKVPIFELFKGSSELARLRIEASHNFRGNIIFRNIFAIGFTPILSFIAYIYAVKTKLLKWRVLFILLFFSALLINVYDLQKAPIFFYILMFILINIYIGKFRLTWGRITILGFFSVCLLIVMYLYIQKVTSIDQFLSYNSGPIGRLILSQIAPFYLHLDLFGNYVDYLNGKSLPGIILNLYDLEQVRSAKLVMENYFPERVEKGIAGVLNTIYAGEAYANFGAAGIVIGTIYIGIVIQIIYFAFLRLPKHPVIISLFVFFTVNIPRVVVGGFADFLFNPFWILIIVIFLGSLLFIRMKNDLVQYIKECTELREDN